MQKFSYDMFDRIEQPTFILSNIYHHHIGEINNIDMNDVNVNINMNSADEMSFNVYKEVNGIKCNVWDDLVSFKYVYVPEHNEYYKIDVTIEEDNSTVKKLTLTSAAEHELSNRIIRSLEVNTESDILQDDYVKTVFYDPNNPRGSLLHRVLSIKTPGWSIGHVDDTLCNIQRTFSISNQNIYQVLTDTIAKEIECLFLFDSVKREISAYDLDNLCLNPECGYRGSFTDECPRCHKKLIKYGYGKDMNVFISYNNFSEKMTVDGDEGQVKNCFYVTGGDENINAAIINCNPSGTAYLYKFSEADYADMPPALVAKLEEYSEFYDENIDEYQEVVANWYDAINNYYYYNTSMMPRINGTAWEAEKYYDVNDMVYVKTLPSWCYLQCTVAGHSGTEEFDATSVYEGQLIQDGEVTWVVKKTIITLPSARQVVEGGAGTPWQASKEYSLDNIIYTTTLPYNYKLKCTQAGKSGTVEPNTSDATLDKVYTDGTVKWTVIANNHEGETPLRDYLGNPDNMIWFLNKLPESMKEINNEVKNISALTFNNIFRMEVIDDDGHNDKQELGTRTVTIDDGVWRNNKFYVGTELMKDQYIPYKQVTAYGMDLWTYRYVDNQGQYFEGEDYEWYNDTPTPWGTPNKDYWMLRKIGTENVFASGLTTIRSTDFETDKKYSYTYYFKLDDHCLQTMPTTRIDENIYRIIYINSLSANPINFGRIQSMTSISVHPKTIDVKPKWEQNQTLKDVPYYKWTGNVKLYNTGDKEDTYTTTQPLTAYLYLTAVYDDYMKYMQVKVQKRLDKKDTTFTSLVNTPIPRDEDGNYDKENDAKTFPPLLTEYSLDLLTGFSKSFTGCLDVMTDQGTGDPNGNFYGYDLYNPLYVPYSTRKQWVVDEMAEREKTVNHWKDLRDQYRDKMLEWQDKFNLEKYIGEDLYTVFFHYIREGDYQNANYISDGISDGEVINYAKKVLELANEELDKATNLQFTLSDSLGNLLNTTEFKNFKERFAIGDYLVCECDNTLYKLRLIGVSYNYGNPESINVTFSNVTKVKNYFSDAQDILSKAQSMSTSYNTTVHQVEKSSTITDEVTSWSKEGMSADVNNIFNNEYNEILYDENGITVREFDDIKQEFRPEQFRIQHNSISFTEDDWKSTALAIGKNTYRYWNSEANSGVGKWEEKDGYGVNAKFVTAGYITGTQIVAGEILSDNWEPNGTIGSFINLTDGSFNFGGGGLTGKWNKETRSYELNYKGNAEVTADVGIGSAIGDWVVTQNGLGKDDSLVTPSVIRTTTSVRSDKLYADTDIYIDNQSLLSTLSSKQDTLVAGDNITIENNVISAVGGTEVVANPSEEPTAVLNTIKIGNIVYAINGGNPTISSNANISVSSGETSMGLQGRRIIE